MNPLNFLCVVILSLSVSHNTEGLKCFVCSYNREGDMGRGEPFCANGNVPEDRLLQDCPSIEGVYPVCEKIFSNQTTPEMFISTFRYCSGQMQLNLTCSTESLIYPDEGTTTTCYCNEDKCEPGAEDGAPTGAPSDSELPSSSSNKCHAPILSVLLLILFVKASM